MKLGSLFDGSGGFPLAGAMNGMTPVWASEIEPYPLRVTAARFPHMKQLGDVTKIDGAGIEPVDVITFGSPCQDLSVAGKQTGIHDGKRSSLFFEAVRIIREMRGATNGKYPRFAVWENVPGAFSSNKGADFRAVLQALCEVGGEAVSVPEPPKGKWAKSGCIVGDGYSIAWRVYDAQYWGVPQRRKRIYLVADFGSEHAGEILFEREGVRGDSAQGREAREGAADDAAGGTGGDCHAFDITGVSSNSYKSQTPDSCFKERDISRSLDTFVGSPECNQGGTVVVCDCIEMNQTPDTVYPEIARTLAARHDSSPCVDRGQNVVALDCRNLIGNADISGTLQAKNEGGCSLNFVNPVVYDCRGNGSGDTVPNLTGDHQNRVTDYTAICLQGNGIDRADTAGCNGCGWRMGEAYTLNTIDRHEVCVGNGQMHRADVYPDVTGALCANSHPGSYTGQDAFNDMLPVLRKDRRYIVRRLTPMECCRLQGFPDWWEDGANGSDSARYKMWGNGIALPCAADVMRRIAVECGICTPLHNTALDLHSKPVVTL